MTSDLVQSVINLNSKCIYLLDHFLKQLSPHSTTYEQDDKRVSIHWRESFVCSQRPVRLSVNLESYLLRTLSSFSDTKAAGART